MASKAILRMVEVEETAEVVVRQNPAEIDSALREQRPRFLTQRPDAEKPTAAILPIYLREMGATPLIDENQEVELARELQDAREELAKLALRLPVACKSYCLESHKNGQFLFPKSIGTEGKWNWHARYEPLCKHGERIPREITDRVKTDVISTLVAFVHFELNAIGLDVG